MIEALSFLATTKRIDKELDKMIKKELVRKSTSCWASHGVLVPKPNRQTRMCFDYRVVNKVTITDSQEESSIPKTAFTIHRGLYPFPHQHSLEIQMLSINNSNVNRS